MKRTTLFCLFLGAAGCGANTGDEPNQDELLALLQDEPLSNVGSTSSALSPGGGSGGGRGDAGVAASDSGATIPPRDGGASAPDTGPVPPRDAGPFVPDAGPGPRPDATPSDATPPGFDGGGDLPDVGTSTPGFDGGGFPDFDGGGGGGDGGGGGSFGALGSWTFDDCNTFRTNLEDSTFNRNTAFRSVNVACATGISGQAVSLSVADEDIVMVPDQPNFLFDGGVTAAGWFNASSAHQTSTLVRKRHDETSAFALLIHQGRYKFVINLGRGRAASVTSRDRAVVGRWTHVAATYDGVNMRLYVDGVEVASSRVRGLIDNSSGPLLMGNDGSRRLFRGLIDNALVDARALTAEEIQELLCLRGNPTISASPSISAPTLPGTPALYDVVVTNNDTPSCRPSDFFFETRFFQPGIDVQPSFSFLSQVPAGGSAQLTLSVTASDDPDPGTYTIPIQVFSGGFTSFATTSVDFLLAASGCRVNTRRELMITNLSVVDDPVRTTGSGAWTFRHLMESMAPTPADAPAMVEAMLRTFTVPQTINGFTVSPRPGFESFILANWPRVDGQLDLSQAPLTLQAIVNRFDLREPANGDAGEGRFVFAFNFPGSQFPLQATLILEYKLPATTPAAVEDWAQAWHALGALPFPSEEYNAALEVLTRRFAGRNARPGATNGSAISTVRTNEIDLGDNGRWELREFRLSAATGLLAPHTLDRTPDFSFNETPSLASFINANEAALLTETHTVPVEHEGGAFAAGAVFNDFIPWNAPGINSSEARFRFSTNTCSGCHSPETSTTFLQISPRFPGSEAFLSAFLTGTTVTDPFTGEPRTLNELGRRAAGLRALVCP